MKRMMLFFALLALLVTPAPAQDTSANDEAINACFDQVYEKFPDAETIKKHYGDKAKVRETSNPSPHDKNLELKMMSLSYPGMEISTLSYSQEGDDRFIILSLHVAKAGLVDFLGIDIGSAKEDVQKKFGAPDSVEKNELHYVDDESGNLSIIFVLDKDKVAEMRFANNVD
jgi:hypothetical protein